MDVTVERPYTLTEVGEQAFEISCQGVPILRIEGTRQHALSWVDSLNSAFEMGRATALAVADIENWSTDEKTSDTQKDG